MNRYPIRILTLITTLLLPSLSLYGAHENPQTHTVSLSLNETHSSDPERQTFLPLITFDNPPSALICSSDAANEDQSHQLITRTLSRKPKHTNAPITEQDPAWRNLLTNITMQTGLGLCLGGLTGTASALSAYCHHHNFGDMSFPCFTANLVMAVSPAVILHHRLTQENVPNPLFSMPATAIGTAIAFLIAAERLENYKPLYRLICRK